MAPATRASWIGGAVGAVVLTAFAVQWTSQPSFELLYSNLDAREAGAVQSALAGANVRFRISQPPGPFVVHVDGDQFYAAQNAVALAGALDRAPEGIGVTAGAASQVFMSAQERAQAALKREWQELEKQLEELAFVERARVSTSIPDRSPLRKAEPMTVAVTLTLRGRAELTQDQATSVARLARFRFNVPAQNVLVTDQSGRALSEDGALDGEARLAAELLQHGQRNDAELERKANDALRRVFGADLAHVVVTSQWRHEEIESVKETVDPKNKVVVAETASKTSTPTSLGEGASGIAGSAGLLVSDPDAEPTVTSATTSETSKTSVVGRETQMRRSQTPQLARLSLSLFLDDSLKDRQGEVEAAVKSAVGFDAERGDSFAAMTAPFAGVRRDGEGKIVTEPEAVVEPPSRFVEFLLQRGIEIAVAIGLLFLLVRALRGGKSAEDEAEKRPPDVDEDRWIEMLARTRVEDLAKTDPERLGAILSRWAGEAEAAGQKREPQGAGR
jgi:flagellar M-ring protein FliF